MKKTLVCIAVVLGLIFSSGSIAAQVNPLVVVIRMDEAQSDSTFILALYEFLLARLPDAPGLAYWQGILQGKKMTRHEVLRSFLKGKEFQERSQRLGLSVNVVVLIGVQP